MTTVSFTDFRANLAHFLDRAQEDCEEIIVHRSKGRKTVVVALDDFLSMRETGYLLSSKKNRSHLAKSLKEAKQGKTIRVAL